MKIIRQEQKLISVSEHVLTDEQYTIFRTLPQSEKISFLSDLECMIIEEEIEVCSKSKFANVPLDKVPIPVLAIARRMIENQIIEGYES